MDGSALNGRYRQALESCDHSAVQAKRQYSFVRRFAFVLTWATLIAAIIAMARPDVPNLPTFVLYRVVPVLSGFITLLTIVQTVLTRQAKWLAHRAAAEKLKEACMRYRFRLAPYGNPAPDADDEELDRTICRIREAAELKEPLKFCDLRYLIYTRGKLGKNVEDTPRAGILPRFPVSDEDSGENAVLGGRLGNQQKWYIGRARLNAALYLLCQLIVILISMANVLNRVLLSIQLWHVALGTTFILACMAWRDVLSFGPLFLNYLRAYVSLERVRKAYLERTGEFSIPDDAERVRHLAERVEEILAAEFEYWHGSR
ncbi:MAG: DUF4231 domain-containing protein [Planctomycetota bacterium]